MDDYIKRGDIAKLAIEEKRFVFQMEDLLKEEIVVKTVYKDFFDFIKSIPAADVAPVRHGMWVNDHGVIGCSYCMMGVERRTEDERREWVDLSKMPFCPACGARMDGGGEDA